MIQGCQGVWAELCKERGKCCLRAGLWALRLESLCYKVHAEGRGRQMCSAQRPHCASCAYYPASPLQHSLSPSPGKASRGCARPPDQFLIQTTLSYQVGRSRWPDSHNQGDPSTWSSPTFLPFVSVHCLLGVLHGSGPFSPYTFTYGNTVCAQSLSCLRLFVTPWTGARQAPLSLEFSKQDYWSGLPFPTPGDTTQGSNPCPLHLLYWQVDSL